MALEGNTLSPDMLQFEMYNQYQSLSSNVQVENFAVKRSNANSPLAQVEFTCYSFLLHAAGLQPKVPLYIKDKYLFQKMTKIDH